jgi:hypothetical protein
VNPCLGKVHAIITFRCSLLSVGLHGNVSVKVVQRAIGFFTAIPSTLVHALDLFVSSSRSLMLLSTGNGNKGVNLGKQHVRQCKKWGETEKTQN